MCLLAGVWRKAKRFFVATWLKMQQPPWYRFFVTGILFGKIGNTNPFFGFSGLFFYMGSDVYYNKNNIRSSQSGH